MEMQGNIDGEIFSTCFTRGSGMENQAQKGCGHPDPPRLVLGGRLGVMREVLTSLIPMDTDGSGGGLRLELRRRETMDDDITWQGIGTRFLFFCSVSWMFFLSPHTMDIFYMRVSIQDTFFTGSVFFLHVCFLQMSFFTQNMFFSPDWLFIHICFI